MQSAGAGIHADAKFSAAISGKLFFKSSDFLAQYELSASECCAYRAQDFMLDTFVLSFEIEKRNHKVHIEKRNHKVHPNTVA